MCIVFENLKNNWQFVHHIPCCWEMENKYIASHSVRLALLCHNTIENQVFQSDGVTLWNFMCEVNTPLCCVCKSWQFGHDRRKKKMKISGNQLPYNRKYCRSLSLVVWPQTEHKNILAKFKFWQWHLAVYYITINIAQVFIRERCHPLAWGTWTKLWVRKFTIDIAGSVLALS